MSLELTQRQMAEAFNRTTRQIRRWEDEGLTVRAEKNRKYYTLREAIEFHVAIEVQKAIRAASPDVMDAARLRKLEAEAESKEIDLSIRRNELVPMDEVEGLLQETLESIDSVLRHAPSRVAPALAKVAKIPIKRARVILEDLVERVRGSIREDRESA